ncbi:cation-transporting P-type ATPase [Candidatus Microgenomates bacterium]|jgi:Mg2+-importing ATPase|nr:MAG: cation-transporting P-type ATPase [Candidatus Microgenomates bacterium]
MHFSTYSAKTGNEVINEFTTSPQGLSSEEVRLRRKQYGLNELSAARLHWYDILLRQFKSPFLYLLLSASFVSFVLGQIVDGLMILLFVLINAFLGFIQEFRSEKTLQLLKNYVVVKSRVLRNGEEEIIKSSELVPGDILILNPGDIIPADVRFIECESLVIDESSLTGESVEIEKTSKKAESETKEIYQAKNIGFAGTNIKKGKALGVVISIGKNTQIGNIASLASGQKGGSNFEKGIARLSGFVLKLVGITLVFVFIANIILKGPVEIPKLFIFVVALAVSVIPETLPVITIFSFSRGALKLAKRRVVIKRLSSIEDLGGVEVLCTDKTGTITENKLAVSGFYPKESKAILFASLAGTLSEKTNDSFELALTEALGEKEKKAYKEFERIKELPFDPERKRNSVLVKRKNEYFLVTKGAPEVIFDLTKTAGFPKKDCFGWIESEGRLGKRVIAVARKKLKEDFRDLEKEEKDLEFIGLLSFYDPLKKTAPAAIANAKSLGVQIKILTGDSKEVAGAIAYEIGLIDSEKEVVTGREFNSFSYEEKIKAVFGYKVFARVTPEQKYEIIKLLQAKYSVGFLGDGINDAPALKAANVALVVQGATDIARESADIVLLNKSLSDIIEGIKEGRKIFGNTVKYIKATLSSNFGNFYAVAIASLFIPFLPLLPLQILLINLLTDFPMISVATDNLDERELKVPKSYDIREITLFSTVMGLVSSLFDFLFFILFFRASAQVLQTSWFIESILTELVFIFSVRSRVSFLKTSKPSFALLSLTGLCLVLTIGLPFSGLGRQFFGFVSPPKESIAIVLLLTFFYFVSSEIVKAAYYRIYK